ncbi:MAG: hypothetical protein Q8M92_08085 [Candidatus Subteraquimicrobiales bacterium]|nr:hypothetical protein [Candidatus Subteraquimicrobiales bacterium]
MKAVALFSGGLDSILAVKLIQEQKIEVIGVSFISPFFGSRHAEKAAFHLRIPLKVIDLTEELIRVIKKPKHGFGKNLNPCIDCRILMVKKAGEFMKESNSSFLVSGEVLGERPMSQNKSSLRIIEEESGVESYLLRPLSAKLLPPTIPEKESWVDREKLLDLKGKSRKAQLSLARKYNLKEFPAPSGGCLLTDPIYSQKLGKLLSLNSYSLRNDLDLLKYGRHFVLPSEARIVVSRNQGENEALSSLIQPDDYLLELKSIPSPLTLIRGKGINEEILHEAARLTVKYSKARELKTVEVSVRKSGMKEHVILVETDK